MDEPIRDKVTIRMPADGAYLSVLRTATALVRKIQEGAVTLADLTAAGAVQLEPADHCSGAAYIAAGFPTNRG